MALCIKVPHSQLILTGRSHWPGPVALTCLFLSGIFVHVSKQDESERGDAHWGFARSGAALLNQITAVGHSGPQPRLHTLVGQLHF